MSNLKLEDIKEIIEFFEKELNTLGGISKVEKMKMRSRVLNVLKPALSSDNPRSRAIIELVEDKLNDILKQFRDGYSFKKKLADLLAKKLK